jgi:hypothetical protein
VLYCRDKIHNYEFISCSLAAKDGAKLSILCENWDIWLHKRGFRRFILFSFSTSKFLLKIDIWTLTLENEWLKGEKKGLLPLFY